MATMTVKNALGAVETMEKPLAPGRAAAALSRPVVLSTEDFAAIGATTDAPAPSDTATASLNAMSKRLAQHLTTLIASTDAVTAATNKITTATASYTRPADTTAYAIGDALANSTSAPTALTFTVAASGKGGMVTDLIVTSSPAPGTPLQGQLWLFDTAPTAVNDNAAFTVSDAEVLTLVAIIPFTLLAIGANSQVHVQNLAIGFTTVAATTLRGLVRVTNAYTPASGEVVTFRLKVRPQG